MLALVVLTSSCGDMVADEEHPEDLMQKYGHNYQVWSGNGPLVNCLDPGGSSFSYLGGSTHSEYFSGATVNFYVVLTEPGNFAFVDAVQDATGDYRAPSWSCNTNQEGNITENPSEPDGHFAWLGTEHSRGQRGALVFNIPSNSSLNVHIADHAYYYDGD